MRESMRQRGVRQEAIPVEPMRAEQYAQDREQGAGMYENQSMDATADFFDRVLEEREQLADFCKRKSAESGLYVEALEHQLLTDREMDEVTTDWKCRLREHTEFLRSTDELGIELFTGDITYQQKLPTERITFGDAGGRQLEDGTYLPNAAQAYRGKERIEIAGKMIGMREQLTTFLKTGVVHKQVRDVIHELVHRRHFSQNAETAAVFTEAQAFWSGVLQGDEHQRGLSSIAVNLHNPTTYDLDLDQCFAALQAIESLYLDGSRTGYAIAKIVADPENYFDAEGKIRGPLGEAVEHDNSEAAARGLTVEDEEGRRDLFRVFASNQRQKAQLLFGESLKEKGLTAEVLHKRMEGRERSSSRRLSQCMPEFVEVFPNCPPSMVVFPCNDAFPFRSYDHNVGIACGMRPVDGKDGASGVPKLCFGTFTKEGDATGVQWDITGAMTAHLQRAFTEVVSAMPLDAKSRLWEDWWQTPELLAGSTSIAERKEMLGVLPQENRKKAESLYKNPPETTAKASEAKPSLWKRLKFWK